MGKAIVFKRSILAAAEKLQGEASQEFSRALDAAEESIAACRDANDMAGARFWRDVWLYLMINSHSPGLVRIVDDEAAPPSNPIQECSTEALIASLAG